MGTGLIYLDQAMSVAGMVKVAHLGDRHQQVTAQIKRQEAY